MNAMDQRLIAISMGDPRGIGPTLIAHLFATEREAMRGCFVVGDLDWMRRATTFVAQQLGGLPIPPIVCIDEPQEALQGLGLYLLSNNEHRSQESRRHVGDFSQVDPAIPLAADQAGRIAADAVRRAAREVLQGRAHALVTAPLNKSALAAAGEPYPGHTELLQALSAEHAGKQANEVPVRMMLANDSLRVVLDSIHVPLAQAVASLNTTHLVQTLRIAHDALSRQLSRPPSLAVAGLNPHAGEAGLLGREEIDIIGPAISQAQALGIQASGPYPPDTVFARARGFAAFDAVIALYHDQGLIPLKYLGLDEGVNFTLGLPFVRTSPDHGTAQDIAWKQLARPQSLRNAIEAARQARA